MQVKSLSHVRLFATPWTVAYQAPPSMEFSRQEYWSGLPFPSPGHLPNPGIESWPDTLPSEPPGKPLNTHTKPTDSMTESPQAKQRTGKEHSPTHQQTTGFFTEHGPAHQGKSQFSPQPVLPSHQEACTSLLHSSTRGQTEEARTIIPQPQKPQSQKANQNEKKLDYVPDEGTR